MQKERVLLENIKLESQLNDSKARTWKLLEKTEDDRHLWDSKKQILQCSVAELQTKIDSMANERGLLYEKNRELNTEAESLEGQLNEYKARLGQMEDERVQNKRALQQCRTESIALQSDLNDSKKRTQDVLQKQKMDMHLWDAEKCNLEGTIAEMNIKHELMANEMGSMAQKNTELTVEAGFSKYEVNQLESELNKS